MSQDTNVTTVILRLPKVENFRKLYEKKDGSGAMYGATCRIQDLYEARSEVDQLLDINPRNQKPSSGPSKAMHETLKDAPQTFVFRNRGLALIAHDVAWDNKTCELKIVFRTNPSGSGQVTNGLADGGHTYDVIKNFVDSIEEAERNEIPAEVRLDIFTGLDDKPDEIALIVDARNTSTQVQDYTLLNNRGVFQPIKDALAKTPYANKIAYYENEYTIETDPTSGFRPIKLDSVLSYVMCFDAEVFTENDHPVRAYSSKKKALDWYKAKWEGKNGGRDSLNSLLTLTPQILDLRDYIEAKIPKVWNKLSGRFADQKGVRKLKNDRELDFSTYTVEYDVPGGYIYPILAAFRSLITTDGKSHRFKDDPKALFDRMNDQPNKSLVYKLKSTTDQDPQSIGKNSDLYGACYASVLAFFYEARQ